MLKWNLLLAKHAGELAHIIEIYSYTYIVYTKHVSRWESNLFVANIQRMSVGTYECTNWVTLLFVSHA